MKNWSQTAEYFFMLQSDWLKFEIELNSLSRKRVRFCRNYYYNVVSLIVVINLLNSFRL